MSSISNAWPAVALTSTAWVSDVRAPLPHSDAAARLPARRPLCRLTETGYLTTRGHDGRRDPHRYDIPNDASDRTRVKTVALVSRSRPSSVAEVFESPNVR